jgi:RNA polymerase sigma factor (TIGR02999 family)
VPTDSEITGLLQRWHRGDRAAFDQLLPRVYAELRRSAERALRHESPGHTLQATALVHEAWMRLALGAEPDWHDQQHFLAGAARLMRQVLIDHARRRDAGKRDGGERLALSGLGLEAAQDGGFDVLALDQALQQLQRLDARKAQLVELRVFGGLEFSEIGRLMALSRATLDREWRSARAFLWRLLEMEGSAGPP